MQWLETAISLLRIWLKNRREFVLIQKTISLARKTMQDQNNGLAWDEADHYSKVAIIFLVKNLHRLQSIKILCRRGLAQDAAPLLRAMFEELADLNYMSADRSRAQDFVDYDTYQRYKMGKILLRSNSSAIDKNRVIARTADLEKQWFKIKHRFTYKIRLADGKERERVHSRWTRNNVRQICDEVGLGPMYDYLFGYLSQYTHSTPLASDGFVLGRNGNYVVLITGASPILVPEILGTSSAIYLDMLRIVNKDFNMNLEEKISLVEKYLHPEK